MPIKLPKGFNRRRSSGNALDGGEPAQSSFRVLERPDTTQHTSDGHLPLRRTIADRPNSSPSAAHLGRPQSYGDTSDASNRASGNTHNSNSTGGGHSSKRFSYASTTQTSVESQDDLNFNERPQYAPIPHTNTEPPEAQPQSRKTFSLKAAGRTFSFGPKSQPKQEPFYGTPTQDRDRATRESSYASTATPPKLELGDSDSGFGQSGFGDVFGKRKSTILEDASPVPPAHGNDIDTGLPRSGHRSKNPSISLTKPHLAGSSDLPRQPESPYSFTSHASQDRLMSSPAHRPSHLTDSTDDFASAFAGTDSQLVLDALYASNTLDQRHNPEPPRHIAERPSPRSNTARSAWEGQGGIKSGPYQGSSSRSPLPASNGLSDQTRSRGLESKSLTYRGAPHAEESLFDAPRSRRPVQPSPRPSTAIKTPNKVMTPAEFELYKARKAQGMRDDDTKSESSESETYEDEDETEQAKQLARQRRRQEAQLSVYRQQMMKVTGKQVSDLPDAERPQMPFSRSSARAPSLLGSLSFEPRKGPKESDEEDDEVPLGVLQAHGFPARNRPPTRISSSASAIQRSESQLASYPVPAGATRNDASAGGGSNGALPVFAKHLPQDPYTGASLVNSTNRESIGMGASGMSTPGQQPAPPGLPPGGLVGVIAGEERARAQRRGSPNDRGTYDGAPSGQTSMEIHHHQQMLAQQQQQMQAMTYSQPGQPMSPNEQSQMQATQQMQQMMQMQMQWMQQMMQMQGIDPSQMPGMAPQTPQSYMGQSNSFLAPPGGQMRPKSTATCLYGGQTYPMSTMSRGPSPQFASSMFNGATPGSSATSMYGMPQAQGGYAPSLAPSERSNVGQPSRYRPVTFAANEQQDQISRTSTMSQQTIQGLGMNKKPSKSALRTTSSAPMTVQANGRPRSRANFASEDENDDEGWADMAKKREQRKSMWKMKKPASTTMPGAQEGGLEGLYYEG